jgi:hypothetical protein
MNFYRFYFGNGTTLEYPCSPAKALQVASSFARWLKRELVGIEEIRPLTNQLELV